MKDDDEIFGNDHFRDFYRRPDVQEKMKRIYDRSQVTATIRARARPRKAQQPKPFNPVTLRRRVFSFD